MNLNQSLRVFVNTLSLYINMIVTMVATLLATRFVLQALGEEQYGIYMLLASVVALFSFLNITMAASIQRYLSYAMGEGNECKVKEIFYLSILIHLGISFLVGIVLLSLGWYAVGHWLDIAPVFRDSAKIVLLCMTGGLLCVINSVTYEATMNAHEDISMIAFINVVEALLKLSAALIVCFFEGLGIKEYAFFLFLAQCFGFLAKWMFCHIRYSESHFKFYVPQNYQLLRELFSYAGYSLIGTTCGMARYQGAAILLNVFFGVLVNAAYGVAQQINGFLLFFAGSIVRPLRPMVIKTEGSGQHERMIKLSFTVSRITFLMMAMVVIPLYMNMPYVLSIWLDDVPKGALIFSRMFLLIVLVNQASIGLQLALESVGRIRLQQLIIGSMHIIAIPVSLILFLLGFSAVSIMYCILAEEIVCTFLRVWIAQKEAGICQRDVYFRMLIPEFLVFSVTFVFIYILSLTSEGGLVVLLYTTLLSVLFVCVLGYTICMSSQEKTWLKAMLSSFSSKISRSKK